MAEPGAGFRVTPGVGVASVGRVDASALADVLSSENLMMTPLFGSTEDRVRVASLAAAGGRGPDLSVFYRVEAPDERLDQLAERLRGTEGIAAAYVKPAPEPAYLNTMVADPQPGPPITPDFTARQFYLEPAPGGIDARFAWTRTGGRGTGVRVIDIEGAWRFSHEDLLLNQGGVVGGTQSTDIRWRNHGTAVVGVIGGDVNTIGVTGISPDSQSSAISVFGSGQNSAVAIRSAADRLSAGDIILIELHAPGPRHNFQNRNDQAGYIAMEWWDDNFAAIQYATTRGVIVVEAAGNGAEDLDDPIYSTRPPGFASTWTNPFNRANRDCGAVIVGAGAPPPGTHGREHGPDRSRLGFSNYGACVDVQGVGREVTTTGYGDLQGGPNEDEWYTDTFSGTSSSSPIVVGAVACVQGALQAAGRARLTPGQVRQHLRATGSPQQDAPGRPATQRIGNRPDLRALFGAVFPKKKEFKERKEHKDIKEIKDHKEKEKEFKEHKEKEFKEVKDKDFKEGKDKDFKERPKEIAKEKDKEKDFFEGGGGKKFPPPEASSPEGGIQSIEARLTGLEAAVSELAHFITSELRPDLTGGALLDEPDQGKYGEG